MDLKSSIGLPVRQAYSSSIASDSGELFINPASAAWSRKAAQRAGFVSNSPDLAIARLPFSSHVPWADTPRPATTINKPTHDVYPETVGRDETATQLNESADAFKSKELPISPSRLGRVVSVIP